MTITSSERGGVLGAMDPMYQRGKIQKESMYYEHKKLNGSLPLVGVNTFRAKDRCGDSTTQIELIRSTPEKKGQQIANVAGYKLARNAFAADGLRPLQAAAGIDATCPSCWWRRSRPTAWVRSAMRCTR